MQKPILKKRDLYLNRMIAFQDTEMIKVITGIRRCGKSSLMKLMAQHLLETGITQDQILEMNFESMSIPDMDARGFYEYVKARICPGKRTYLFFDEVIKWQVNTIDNLICKVLCRTDQLVDVGLQPFC